MNKQLTRTKKWTEGKPELLAHLSTYIALNSNNLYKVKQTKRNTNFLDADISDNKQWHSYYENFNLLAADFIVGFSNFLRTLGIPIKTDSEKKLIDSLRNPSFKLKEQFKNVSFKNLLQGCEQLRPLAIECVKQFFLNDFVYTEEQNKMAPQNKLVFENQGMAFVHCVLVPCMLEYQAAPHELYDKAIEGNHEALERLVNLDKNIITNHKIAPIWMKLASNPTTHRFKRISKALSEKPNSRMNTRTTKATHAAIIELMFQYFNNQGIINYKLSRTELFELFDNVSRDLEGAPYDYEFPDTPEARDRVVNREKKRIKSFLESIGISS